MKMTLTEQNVPIAVIGHSYHAPGAGRKRLWEYLAEAKSAWSKTPEDRLGYDAYYHPDNMKPGTIASEGAHFLEDDIYKFDAPFFNMRADEARAVDPQHRLVLECAFEAAENAGLSLLDLAGANIGVFATIGSTEYWHQLSEDIFTTTPWSALGGALCMFANRLSYFFDLKGPSVSLDAACASSAYAVHLACQSLRAGECKAAFVGASALIMGPNQWNCLDKLGALSSEGKSFSYDWKASGFGRGEGGGCLMLKRLDEAIKDGDTIQAIIRNTAVNHCGRSDGISMPNQAAQESLLTQVHKDIGLHPWDTPVVEGHGTGTPAGDPIEGAAFASVLGEGHSPSNPLYIGSIKSNIGHLECASGVLSVIKAIMMLQRECILPNAGFEMLNPAIKGGERLKVPTTVLPWPTGTAKRVLVTNFGFGGSNAAIILEKAPSISRQGKAIIETSSSSGTFYAQNETTCILDRETYSHCNDKFVDQDNVNLNNTAIDGDGHSLASRLFVFSAKSKSSLTSYLSSFESYLESEAVASTRTDDMCFTLGQRRTHFPYRTAIFANSVFDLKGQLSAAKISKIKERNVAWVFTGQGAQYARMASGLRRYTVFAKALDEAAACLQEFGAQWSLKDELEILAPQSRIDDAELSQPACTAIQLSLVALLKSWGVTPSTVIGHSSGEIAAAFAAGFVSFRAAMAIAYYRGQAASRLTQKHSQEGAMLALGVSAEVASSLLRKNKAGYATIGAYNSPQSVTMSGDVAAIENIQSLADTAGHFTRRLKVSVAYHSDHMSRVAEWYRTSITEALISEGPPPVQATHDCEVYPTFISSVTGKLENATSIDLSYWVKNLVQPVMFADAMQNLLSSSTVIKPNVLLEIGPHAALKSSFNQIVNTLQENNERYSEQFVYLASLVRGMPAEEALIDMARNLFVLGASIQLGPVNQTSDRNSLVLNDLPLYEWDKPITYIHRWWTITEKLNPGLPFAPLLGRKSIYGNGNELTFRHVFTLDDIPWIRDHNVAGQVIFPMTGYLSLAVEAMRRVSEKVPSSILIREFHVKRSLDFEEDERVDLTTRLRPAATGTEQFSATLWDFEITSWTQGNGWIVHCHGQIEPETSDMSLETFTFKQALPLLKSSDMKELDAELAYSSQSSGGTLYGPSFRAIRWYWEGPGFTVMEGELRQFDAPSQTSFGSPVSVDPPTLDSHLQGIWPFQATAAYVPNYVTRVRISNNIPAAPKQRFTIVTRLLNHDSKAGKLITSVAVFAHSNDSLLPVAEWEAVTNRSIQTTDRYQDATDFASSYCWDLVPSMDFIDDIKFAKMIVDDPGKREIARHHRRKVEMVATYYMAKALKETAEYDFSKAAPHLLQYRKWSEDLVSRVRLDPDAVSSSMLEEIATADAQGEMLCAVGEKLPAILRGEVQPLEIMVKDGLLMRTYEQEAATQYCISVIAKYVCHLSDIKPDLKILEIGGGTASATRPVLEELTSHAGSLPAYLTYTFTDISTAFFDNARTKLSKWASCLTYKRLDISNDPVEQGFVAENYDIVIASEVLHATPNIVSTIDNVRKLLKPNGKLLLVETICHPALTLPFALLPGWWLSVDEFRNHEEGPFLSEQLWDSVLSSRGFSGVEAKLADYPNTPDHVISALCTTRTTPPAPESPAATYTVCGLNMTEDERKFCQAVSDTVASQLGVASCVKLIAEINPVDHPFCIFIDSPSQSLLKNLPEDHFDMLRDTFLNSKGVLWVIPEKCAPEAESIKGLFRALRHETEGRGVITLENIPFTSEGAIGITQVAKRLQNSELSHSPGVRDQDFTWQDGRLHVPRLCQLEGARDIFASEAGLGTRKIQNIWQGDEALEMTIEAQGSPDAIYFRSNNDKSRPLADDEVLIKVEAAGVNFRDLLLVLGSMPWAGPGSEGAGIIVKAGKAVTDVKVGDRVFYSPLEGGCFATYIRMASWRVCQIPDDMSSSDAASIAVAYATAIFSIIRVGRLRKGESILIHAGSGAVGQACIILAQHVGARIFTTAGSPTKRDFLNKTFGIPHDHIFSSRNADFKDKILLATNGNGVDVVVNSLSGDLLQETWALIADFGRFVEIGKKDLLANSHLGMRPFIRNVTYSGLDLRHLFQRRPEEEKECLADIMRLIHEKVIVPVKPVTTLPISQIVLALRKLQSGQNIGKIVLTFGPDDAVLTESFTKLAVPSGQLLNDEATYVITGGTGGIGISLGTWMARNGARHIVLLGRSGSSRPEVKKLLDQFEGSNVCIKAIACDVGSHEELSNALQSLQNLPPVRGVIHGALHLQDSMFKNATYDDWRNINRPRVQGAWNLHELLPNLDFFIILSSFVAATGNVGQAIYAGTGTFFEGFVRYRHTRGLPAVSVGLPVVLDVGYAADHGLTEVLTQSLGATLREGDLQTAVKGAIIGQSSGLNSEGIAMPFKFQSTDDPNTLHWRFYHPMALTERINAKQRNEELGGHNLPDHGRSNRFQTTSNNLTSSLLSTMMDKVSSLTMIERDEVEPDFPLTKYGLDSLVSVELRNWIRRETGIELPLPKIINAASLRALTDYILAQREVKKL